MFHRPYPGPATDKCAVASIRDWLKRNGVEPMRNTMEIEGYRALIEFDPDIEMFRGEFVGLNGGADFYARDIPGLRREGAASLEVFLDMCKEDGVEPRKQFSGKFNVRIPPGSARGHCRRGRRRRQEPESVGQGRAARLRRWFGVRRTPWP